jgi:hypothetical protein
MNNFSTAMRAYRMVKAAGGSPAAVITETWMVYVDPEAMTGKTPRRLVPETREIVERQAERLALHFGEPMEMPEVAACAPPKKIEYRSTEMLIPRYEP